CLISSFGYVLNDLHDAESDRQHPTKRLRPIPSGRLPRSAAFASLLPLAVGGALITATLGRDFAWTILLYMTINFLYTQLLKRIVLLDVFAIVTSIVVRPLASVALMLSGGADPQLS